VTFESSLGRGDVKKLSSEEMSSSEGETESSLSGRVSRTLGGGGSSEVELGLLEMELRLGL